MTHIAQRRAGLAGAVWFAVVAPALGPGLVHAQGTTPADTDIRIVASDWRVTCRPAAADAAMICEGAREFRLQGTEQVFAALYLTPLGPLEAAEVVLRLQLPHGIDLPAGITLAIDGVTAAAPVARTSSTAGLFAVTPLSADLAQQLRAGESLEIAFASVDGQTFNLRAALQGITAVLDMVMAR